jgi:hypothetical protein
LFTLVGIAGEDDLDAPDLIAPADQAARQPSSEVGKAIGWGGNGSTAVRTSKNRSAKSIRIAPTPILEPDQSAVERDRLLAEIESLDCSVTATKWAQRALGDKNRLTAPDAKRVEDAFQTKLAGLNHQRTVSAKVVESPSVGEPCISQSTLPIESIDKSTLTFPEPRRIRDKHHRKFITTQPCLICGRTPCDAHHLRFAQHRALGHKVSDEFIVALCRVHHREVHNCGVETAWWERAGIDAVAQARRLWLATHPLPTGRPR